MLTLDSTLQAAQDSQTHKPIIKLLSSESVADIPFNGNLLTSETIDEIDPDVLTHSSGRICLAYILNGFLHYVYTDTGRTTFTHVSFGTYSSVIEVSLCEMTGGNIGIIYVNNANPISIRRKIISVEGVQVSDAEIFNLSAGSYLSGPFVLTVTANSYLMIYVAKSGSDYYFYKRTSSDFVTWSAASQMTVGGLTASKRLEHPSLCLIIGGNIFLSFDYLEQVGTSNEELINCYRSISSDSGATWGTAAKYTNFTTYGTVGVHPIAVQKAVDTLHIVYTQQSAALWIGANTQGAECASNYNVADLHFDATTRKLYAYLTAASSGLSALLKINVDTWTAEKCYNCETAPAIDDIFCYFENYNRVCEGEGIYSVFAIANYAACGVLNAQTEELKYYFFKSLNVAGFIRDMNVTWDAISEQIYLVHAKIDSDNARLWVILANNSSQVTWGYFDLTAELEEQKYTFNAQQTISCPFGYNISYATCKIYPDAGYAILSQYNAADSNLRVYNLEDGGLLHSIKSSGTGQSTFHYLGFNTFAYSNGKIYGGFIYESGYGQSERRGLAILNIGSAPEITDYYRPTWGTHDDYMLRYIYPRVSNGRVYITHYRPGFDAYGMSVFNPTDGSWVLYNNANTPGLTYNGSDTFDIICIDETTDTIYMSTFAINSFISAFSTQGKLKRSYYMLGTYSGSWSFGTANPLVVGNLDYDASICFDPSDNSMWAFWINSYFGEESIKWDKESIEVDLADDLVKGEEISWRRSIDGSPTELNFVLARGYLYDPHNIYSVLKIYTEKGRKIMLQVGENIGGTNYWQNQGVFYVSESSLSYEREVYPAIKIKCFDRTALWDELDMIASEACQNYPEDIIKNLVDDWDVNFDPGDIILPAFDKRTLLYPQWLDTPLMDAIMQICHRFGYYPRIDVDGKLTARKLSISNTVDHTYSTTAKQKIFTPDDSFSSNVNKIIVTGQERSFTTVQYNEERVGHLYGTFGWWVTKRDFQINYSEDHSRECVSPRLVVLNTATNILCFLSGGVTESITYVDPDNHYCIVTIEGNTEAAIAALLGSIALWLAADILSITDAPAPATTGHVHARWGTTICDVALFIGLNVLGSTVNYQFEIWASPTGGIRRSIQSEPPWEDLPLQNKLGMVIPKKYEDPLCYTVSECTDVANYEGMITQYQRKRAKATKIMHLQDEEGDTIQFPHPHTGDALRVFITDLCRRITIPKEANEEANVFDDIEFWVITP